MDRAVVAAVDAPEEDGEAVGGPGGGPEVDDEVVGQGGLGADGQFTDLDAADPLQPGRGCHRRTTRRQDFDRVDAEAETALRRAGEGLASRHRASKEGELPGKFGDAVPGKLGAPRCPVVAEHKHPGVGLAGLCDVDGGEHQGEPIGAIGAWRRIRDHRAGDATQLAGSIRVRGKGACDELAYVCAGVGRIERTAPGEGKNVARLDPAFGGGGEGADLLAGVFRAIVQAGRSWCGRGGYAGSGRWRRRLRFAV
ncbi:MAG: hypothetical protein M5U18_09115 [Dehalococcoidia bacterium]|nr:hypothetical protein [Dehalococcoidia bacterium]